MVVEILEHLGDHFAGAGSACFQIIERGVLQGVHAAAVMIDNHGFACPLIELGIQYGAFTLRIHNDKHRTRPEHLHDLLRGADRIMVKLIGAHCVDCTVDGGVGLIQHEVRLASNAHRTAHQAERRTDAIHVRIAVPHYEHLIRALHQLAQRFCKQTRFHAGLLGCCNLPLAAIKRILCAALNNRLVAAPAERKLHALPRGFIRLGDAVFHAHGDGKRNLLLRAGFDAAHGVKQGKALLFKLCDALCLEHDEKAGVFVAPVCAFNPRHKFAHKPFHFCEHRVAVKLLIGVQLVVIVHINESHGRHLLLIQAGIVQRFRAVDPVLEHEPARIWVFALHGHAHHLEVSSVDFKGLRLCGEAGFQTRHKLRDVLPAVNIMECRITPQDAPLAVKQQRGNADAVHDLCRSGSVFQEDIVHGRAHIPPQRAEGKQRAEKRQKRRKAKRQPKPKRPHYGRQNTARQACCRGEQDNRDLRLSVHVLRSPCKEKS